MFKQLVSIITHDDNPRLHRIPFLLMWIAAYGLGWFAVLFSMVATDDLFDYNIYDSDFGGLYAVVFGLIFGFILSLVQTWAVRQRYGFVPKFWRMATIASVVLSSYFLYRLFWDWSSSDSLIVVVSFVWFSLVTIAQAMVLFPVNRQAWLMAATGILAGAVASAILFFEPGYYEGEMLAIIVGSTLQIVGSGIVMLRLMANPREGVVPKREPAEKAKTRRAGLHPMSFMGLWAGAHLIGWALFFFVWVTWMLTLGRLDMVESIVRWLEINAEWSFGLFFGFFVGLPIAIAQPWLMKQHSGTTVRHWILPSLIGWSLAGIGFWHYVESYNVGETFEVMMLAVWFVLPALFQTIQMWRTVRGGWIWAATGIVTAIIAALIHFEFAWTYNDTFYAVMLGAIVQAIISGATFLILKMQSQPSVESVAA